ncbi:2TM domain-containing protein [Spongiimicrobium sp. 3-5]|uniref:2TM domain-containing protein n=1 Tax=Spongiimicrobium sp. 3-5 TaxID=3332596 RepID=UPI00398145DE
MELKDNNGSDKFTRAKKRVEELKGFYIHLTVYLAVNTFITVMKVVRNLGEGETLQQALFDFGSFAIWIFWGIGVLFHALKVFSLNPFLTKGWEDRQIQKFIEEDKKEAERYK